MIIINKMKKVLMLFFFCLLFSVSVQAKTTLLTDKTTAGAGCTLVGVEGSYVTQAKEALAKVIGEAHNLEVENSNN